MNVLATTDGSEYSLEALRRMARYVPRTARILLLAAYPNPYVGTLPAAGVVPIYIAPIEDQFRREAQAFASEGLEILRQAGFGDLTCLVRQGEAAPAILDVAAEEDVDLIIVGSHGRTGWRRFLLGSVAYQVVQHAPCSVLVIKHGDRPAADAGS